MFAKILNNRFYIPAPLEPIISNNPKSLLREYDKPTNFTDGVIIKNSRIFETVNSLNEFPILLKNNETASEVINILQGKKEGSLEALATAY